MGSTVDTGMWIPTGPRELGLMAKATIPVVTGDVADAGVVEALPEEVAVGLHRGVGVEELSSPTRLPMASGCFEW